MTEAEARKEALNQRRPLGWCPRLNARCRIDCADYDEPVATRAIAENNKWVVLAPSCRSWIGTINV